MAYLSQNMSFPQFSTIVENCNCGCGDWLWKTVLKKFDKTLNSGINIMYFTYC